MSGHGFETRKFSVEEICKHFSVPAALTTGESTTEPLTQEQKAVLSERWNAAYCSKPSRVPVLAKTVFWSSWDWLVLPFWMLGSVILWPYSILADLRLAAIWGADDARATRIARASENPLRRACRRVRQSAASRVPASDPRTASRADAGDS